MGVLINPSIRKTRHENYGKEEDLVGAIYICKCLQDKKRTNSISKSYEVKIISRLRHDNERYLAFKRNIPPITWENLPRFEILFGVKIYIYEQPSMKIPPVIVRHPSVSEGLDVVLISRKKVIKKTSSLRLGIL